MATPSFHISGKIFPYFLLHSYFVIPPPSPPVYLYGLPGLIMYIYCKLYFIELHCYYSFTHRELYYSGTTLFHLPNLSLINGNIALGGTRMPVFKFYYYIFSSNSFWLLINTLMENIMIIKYNYLIYIKHLVFLWLLMKTTLI